MLVKNDVLHIPLAVSDVGSIRVGMRVLVQVGFR
jgi:hypothetical protein